MASGDRFRASGEEDELLESELLEDGSKFLVSGERNGLLKRWAMKNKDKSRASGEEDKLFKQIRNGKWETIQSLWWRGWHDGKKSSDGEDEFRASGEEDE